MKKYRVEGKVTVFVIVELEANSKKEAKDKALENCHYLDAFGGNGGYDKLIGVTDTDEAIISIDGSENEIRYVSVEEVEE